MNPNKTTTVSKKKKVMKLIFCTFVKGYGATRGAEKVGCSTFLPSSYLVATAVCGPPSTVEWGERDKLRTFFNKHIHWIIYNLYVCNFKLLFLFMYIINCYSKIYFNINSFNLYSLIKSIFTNNYYEHLQDTISFKFY